MSLFLAAHSMVGSLIHKQSEYFETIHCNQGMSHALVKWGRGGLHVEKQKEPCLIWDRIFRVLAFINHPVRERPSTPTCTGPWHERRNTFHSYTRGKCSTSKKRPWPLPDGLLLKPHPSQPGAKGSQFKMTFKFLPWWSQGRMAPTEAELLGIHWEDVYY